MGTEDEPGPPSGAETETKAGFRTGPVLLAMVAFGILVAFGITLAVRDSETSDGGGSSEELFAGIASKCSRTVDVELNRLIAAAADGSTLVLPRKACFGIDGPLVLAGKSNFTLDGNGATVRALTPGGPDRANVEVRGGSGVTVVDLVVEGAFPGPAQDGQPGSGPADGDRTGTQYGVALRSVRGATVRHVRSANTGGECLVVGSDPAGGQQPSGDVLVEQLDCRHSGGHGVAIVNGERVVLRDATIDDVHDCAVAIGPDAENQVARDVQVEGVRVGVTWAGAVCNGGEGTSPNVGNVWVVGNEMTAAPSSCAGAVNVVTPAHLQAVNQNRAGYRFIGNRFRSISYGFVLSGLSGVELSGNSVERLPERAMVCADFSRTPPDVPPALGLRNVHGLRGQDNRWPGYDEVVRADDASRDVQI